MTPRHWLGLTLASVFVASVAPQADAQFDPRGRTSTRRPATTAPVRATRPKPKPPVGAVDVDGRTQGEPSAEALIARYLGIVLAQPGSPFPLQRLAQLYRERDGNLDKLIELLRAKAGSVAAPRDAPAMNALLALAGIYQEDGRADLAVATYERAITEQPTHAAALSALARLLKEKGELVQARAHFEGALGSLKDAAEIEQTLRTLLEIALDLKDFSGAKEYHKKLVQRAQGSFFVRAELGRELMLRGHYEEAETEYREVVKAAAGDNRVLAPALRDLGAALRKGGKVTEALGVLRRALAAAGAQGGIRREILEIMVAVYRDGERLPELVTLLSNEHPDDFERLRLLGGLYEEVGRVEEALKTYRRALTRDPKAIEVRLRTVQLLQLQGDLDGAIAEYQKLTRAAPRNPEFVFQLAEALIQRGSRPEALRALEALEQRSRGDDETLTALVDFYEHLEEPKLATRVLEQLTRSGSRDPRHLIELGDRQFQAGDVQRARLTWQQLLLQIPNRAAALLALGEVYLEHDFTDEALKLLKQALELQPKQVKYKKAYATALERTGASASSKAKQHEQYVEAARLWEEILRDARADPNLARDARQHVVTLWSLSGQLKKRVAPLARQFRADPPDLDAGRLLAEALLRLHRFTEAEATLRAISAKNPGDTQALVGLENVLVRQRRLADAILILKQLVQAEPKRAREYYQRMARYSAELYEDDAALLYAARTVELSPDDAEGHRKLGEMYRQRQEIDKAIQAFRQAILRNDRLFLVYFQLAELLIGKGKVEEADQLLRRVFRAAPDEELVMRAVRASVQLNLGRGTLASLEKDLLPVALGNPQGTVYRRLLVELYGTMAFPLMQQSKSSDPDARAQARAELRRIGERAVKPLLDALSDSRGEQQQTAIELLAHIENRGAGPALLAYAATGADPALRTRAVIAAGALRDPALLQRFRALLVASGAQGPSESDPVGVAAAWAVAELRSRKARTVLRQMIATTAPSVRALGALGLGMLGDRTSLSELRALAGALDAGPLPRAAAAHALGLMEDARALPVLTRLSESRDPILRETVILALARLEAPAAERAIAEALLSSDPPMQDVGVAAALVYTTGSYQKEAVRIPEAQVDVRELLRNQRPGGYTPEQYLTAVARLTPALKSAATATVQTSAEGARAVANVLLDRGGELGFRPLTLRLAPRFADEHEASAFSKRLREAVEPLCAHVVEPFRALANHPLAAVRGMALQFLAKRLEPSATTALVRALRDSDERVQRAALEALSSVARPNGREAIIELLATSENWALRARAATSLGAFASGAADPESIAALRRLAQKDPYSLVREAAVRALVAVDPRGSRETLLGIGSHDPEPRVRRLAQELAARPRVRTPARPAD